MTRDTGWRLLVTGRLLERLLGLSATLETYLAAGALQTTEGVDALLELFDSTITFRARHQRHDDLLALADVLVLDDANPRSLAGVLRRLRTELGKLPSRGAAPPGPQLHLPLADAPPGWEAMEQQGVQGPQTSIADAAQRLPSQGVGLSLEDLQADVSGRLQERCQFLHTAALALAEDIAQNCFSPGRLVATAALG